MLVSSPRHHPSYYAVLECDETVTVEELRRSYQRLILRYHPDKLAVSASASSSTEFVRIQTAWETLRDATSRQQYDQQLKVQRERERVAVSDEIPLCEFSVEQRLDSARQYTYPCRCGMRFSITQQQLEFGFELVGCEGCSLHVRVLYTDQEADAIRRQHHQQASERKVTSDQ